MPIGLRDIRIQGEIGRRIDATIYQNLLALNVETDFLAPFRERNKASNYVGLGKLIDSCVRFAAYTRDPGVLALKNHLVTEAVKTQEADGYIGTLIPASRVWGVYDVHEMSYLVLGLTSDHQYFGEQASLAAARRLADYIITRWSAEPARIPGPSGERGQMYGVTTGLDGALLALYEQTNERRYLNFLINFEAYKLPAWNATIKTLAPAHEPPHMDDETHTYIHMALCAAQLQLYTLQPDPRLLQQARKVVDFLTQQDALLISGSCSRHEAWHTNQCGSEDTSESCATAYLTRMLHRLLRLTGDPRFGDMMERAVYNALFAAQSPDGRKLRYFTPLEGERPYYFRDIYCCPNNFRRIIAELPDMIYYQSGDGLTVNLYTQSTARVDWGGGRSVTIQQETDYPTSGLVKFIMTPSAAMEFSLRLRVPRWCQNATLAINGETPLAVSSGENFYEIRRMWQPADFVTLDLPMPWRLVRGRKLQEGRAALMRGPVVYCLGTAHNAELLKRCKSPVDLMVDPASLGKPVADQSVRPEGLKVSAKAWPPESEHQERAPLEVVLTEFVDPSGVATYFRLPDLTKTVDDELRQRTVV